MHDEATKAALASESGRPLMKAAFGLASSADSADHDALYARLIEPGFLDRLDSEDDYRDATARRLRVDRVVEMLARNPAASAQAAIDGIASDETFTSNPERVDALLRASVHVRPPSDALVAFWDRFSQPDDGHTPITVTSLIENGTPAAIALFERKLQDTSHEAEDKIAWMRSRVLPHRHDVPLLEGCQRLLRAGLSPELRTALVEALFDYRPESWYKPASVANPPVEPPSDEASALRAEIARVALAEVSLDEAAREAVESARR